MGKRKPRARRDVERDCSPRELAATLRRLAACLAAGRKFRLQVAGERITVPAGARLSIEHERGATEEEIEFQLVWTLPAGRAKSRGKR